MAHRPTLVLGLLLLMVSTVASGVSGATEDLSNFPSANNNRISQDFSLNASKATAPPKISTKGPQYPCAGVTQETPGAPTQVVNSSKQTTMPFDDRKVTTPVYPSSPNPSTGQESFPESSQTSNVTQGPLESTSPLPRYKRAAKDIACREKSDCKKYDAVCDKKKGRCECKEGHYWNILANKCTNWNKPTVTTAPPEGSIQINQTTRRIICQRSPDCWKWDATCDLKTRECVCRSFDIWSNKTQMCIGGNPFPYKPSYPVLRPSYQMNGSLNVTCKHSSDCKNLIGAVCDKQLRQCACPLGYYFDKLAKKCTSWNCAKAFIDGYYCSKYWPGTSCKFNDLSNGTCECSQWKGANKYDTACINY